MIADTEPVRVFRVKLEGGAPTRTTAKGTERSLRRHWRGGVFSLAGLALIAAVIVFVQHLSLRPPATTASIPPVQSPALPLPDKPSIAVLPFTNMSGDRDEDYFSDGITDDLITALSRVPGLFVIARTSAFTYRAYFRLHVQGQSSKGAGHRPRVGSGVLVGGKSTQS